MTNDLKLVPGHLTRFCRQQYPALGWRAGRAASRPHGGHSILFLLLLLPFSSSFSSLLPAHSGSNSPREAAARSGGQEAATDGKPPKLLISLANLWTRQVFLDFHHHQHSLLITSQPSHCSYRIVSKRQNPPWPKK